MPFGVDPTKMLMDALLGMFQPQIRDALPALMEFIPPFKIEEDGLLFDFNDGKGRVPTDGITLLVKPTARNKDTVERLMALSCPNAVVVASTENSITILRPKKAVKCKVCGNDYVPDAFSPDTCGDCRNKKGKKQ